MNVMVGIGNCDGCVDCIIGAILIFWVRAHSEKKPGILRKDALKPADLAKNLVSDPHASPNSLPASKLHHHQKYRRELVGSKSGKVPKGKYLH